MDIKEVLYKKCVEVVNLRVSLAEREMKAAQDSANEEGKSTAGDKYDTARAMSHIERDMYAKQLVEAASLKKGMNAFKSTTLSENVELGSLVLTDTASYYIAVGIGRISINQRDYFAVSPMSPIGQQLIGKRKGDHFVLQNKEITILEVL